MIITPTVRVSKGSHADAELHLLTSHKGRQIKFKPVFENHSPHLQAYGFGEI